jgi:pimeloyl-ACP methyl ester carboxylesterase
MSWHCGGRQRAALAALVAGSVLAGMASMAAMIVGLSFRLTNPAGYTHPGPGAGLRPAGPEIGSDPATDFGFAYQDVAFPTDAHAILRGWLVPGAIDARVGVVTAHGRGGDRRDFLRHLPIFHELGMPTLLFDYREHGTSDGAGRGMSLGAHESEDISAAVRYLKEATGVERVVVVGVSLGASSAILAAARDRAIDAVVGESPIASMAWYVHDEVNRTVGNRPLLRDIAGPGWWPGLVVGVSAWRQGVRHLQAPCDVVDSIAPRPLLLIHGTGDVAVDVAHSEALYARARAPKQLWIADGAEHTRVFDRHAEQYRARMHAFLRSIATDDAEQAARPDASS